MRARRIRRGRRRCRTAASHVRTSGVELADVEEQRDPLELGEGQLPEPLLVEQATSCGCEHPTRGAPMPGARRRRRPRAARSRTSTVAPAARAHRPTVGSGGWLVLAASTGVRSPTISAERSAPSARSASRGTRLVTRSDHEHPIAVADPLVDVGDEHGAEHVVRDQREHAAEHDEARNSRRPRTAGWPTSRARPSTVASKAAVTAARRVRVWSGRPNAYAVVQSRRDPGDRPPEPGRPRPHVAGRHRVRLAQADHEDGGAEIEREPPRALHALCHRLLERPN